MSDGSKSGNTKPSSKPSKGYYRNYFWNKNNNNNSNVNCSVIQNENERFACKSDSNCPFKYWCYYFPDEEYKKSLKTVNKVSAVYSFLQQHKLNIFDSKLEEKKYYCFDYKTLCESDELCTKWPTFVVDLTENPLHSLQCMGLALSHLINQEEVFIPSFGMMKARLNGFDNLISIKSIKAQQFGKLVAVKGVVIRVGPVRLMSSFLTFSCKSCSSLQSVHQSKGLYSTPKSCPVETCTSRSFIPCISSSHTLTRCYQNLKLQENIEDDREGGRIPRTIECELTDDLVDSCGPGDSVTLIGIVQVDAEENQKKSKGTPNLFNLTLEAVSIINSKGKVSSGRNNACTSGVQFSLKDYYAIQEIYSEKDHFRLLVNSICPSVYGHELVKAGILLALAGGAGAGQAGRSARGDPHVLIVGDPGLGKSHMLHAASAVAPRGVYVCGNTTTSSGLTVTLSREKGGDFALEAGALVLADKGTCSIDEFDKMTSQHQALLEAMEQQSVSIAKGGVVCTLPARTSIIAAANPVGGHYNCNKTVAENLNMGQPLLSRFDLVFILLDRPNEELDYLLSEHVMNMHTGVKTRDLDNTFCSVNSLTSTQSQSDSIIKLSDRLRFKRGEKIDLIPQALLRKYIAYARKYVVQPTLSKGAVNSLQNFYLELRKFGRDGPPVTTRQLESLIRLTQARAKIELREEATEDDARDVIELVKASMIDVFSDKSGQMNFSRSQNGSGTSGGSRVKRYISALQRRSRIEQKVTFNINELKKLCMDMNLKVPDFYSFISTLNVQGFLLKKGNNTYKLIAEG